jgi:hypothetical protein
MVVKQNEPTVKSLQKTSSHLVEKWVWKPKHFEEDLEITCKKNTKL